MVQVMGGEEVFEEMDVDRETLGTTLLTKVSLSSAKATGLELEADSGIR